MNVLGLILGLGVLALVVYEIVGIIKDVRRNRALKSDTSNKNNNNKEGVND